MNGESIPFPKVIDSTEIKTESENICKNMNTYLNPIVLNEHQNLYHYEWCPIASLQNQSFPSNVNTDEEQNLISVSDFSNKALQPNFRPTFPFPYPSTITGTMMRSPPIPFMPFIPPMPSMSSIPSSYGTNEAEQYERMVKKRYSCRICNNSFETMDYKELRAHLHIHSAVSAPFDCQICGKRFKFRSLWRNHIMAHMVVRDQTFRGTVAVRKASYSMSNNMLNCDQCEYNCKEKSKMDRHKRMHSGMKPFKCPSCHYESYDKTKIRRHYVTHTREKPFSCERCKSRFTQSGSLKGHLVKVHGIVNIKLNCAHCETFSASTFGELRIHIKQMHENALFAYAIAN